MRIAFVYPTTESLGVEYLSAIAKENGHETRLFFDPRLFDDDVFCIRPLAELFSYSNYIVDQIILYKPQLIAFSVLTFNYLWACKIAREIKKKINIPVVFGGIHPTSVPEVVLNNDFVDFVIRGEGEYALIELVNNLESKMPRYDIENIWFKSNGEIIKNPQRPLIHNLNNLPFPDKEIFYKEDTSFKIGYTLMTGRGCPYSCTFCLNNFLRRLNPNEKYLRRRSVDNVISELVIAKNKYLIKQIEIYDDDFCYNEKWLGEFLEKYRKEINIPFHCFAHPNEINEKICEYLKYAGCVEVDIGIQTLNEGIKRYALHRYETEDEVRNSIRLLKKYGIRCVTDNIIGLPGQTEEDLIYLAKFYLNNKPDKIHLFRFQVFPKTEIESILKDKGLLSEKELQAVERGFCSYSLFWGRTQFETKFKIIMLLISILPKRMAQGIINKRIFSHLPFWGTFYFLLFFIFFDSVTKINLYKKRSQLRYYRYMFKNLLRFRSITDKKGI